MRYTYFPKQELKFMHPKKKRKKKRKKKKEKKKGKKREKKKKRKKKKEKKKKKGKKKRKTTVKKKKRKKRKKKTGEKRKKEKKTGKKKEKKEKKKKKKKRKKKKKEKKKKKRRKKAARHFVPPCPVVHQCRVRLLLVRVPCLCSVRCDWSLHVSFVCTPSVRVDKEVRVAPDVSSERPPARCCGRSSYPSLSVKVVLGKAAGQCNAV